MEEWVEPIFRVSERELNRHVCAMATEIESADIVLYYLRNFEVSQRLYLALEEAVYATAILTHRSIHTVSPEDEQEPSAGSNDAAEMPVGAYVFVLDKQDYEKYFVDEKPIDGLLELMDSYSKEELTDLFEQNYLGYYSYLVKQLRQNEETTRQLVAAEHTEYSGSSPEEKLENMQLENLFYIPKQY